MDLLRELKAMPITLHLLQVGHACCSPAQFQEQQCHRHVAGLPMSTPTLGFGWHKHQF